MSSLVPCIFAPWLSALPDHDEVFFGPGLPAPSGCDAAHDGYHAAPLARVALVEPDEVGWILATLVSGLSDPGTLSERDRERWRAACAGDPDVRKELVDLAVAGVAMRLRRFAGHDLDELRQRIAVAVLHAFEGGLEPQSSLEGFLQWRARGQISRFVRERVRDGRMANTDALDWASGEDSPLRRASETELWQAVFACIEKVPSRDQREAFQQRVVDGLQPREIAEARGVEAGRVRVWIARAAVLVRECLSRRFRAEDL